MTTSPRRTHRAAAVALAVTASSVAVHGAASADSGHAGASPVTSVPLTTGLYQLAYSERNDTLWATSSAAAPPVTESRILRIDPDTLEIRSSFRPPVSDPETGAVEAVYGIAVDDEHNTLWTTNTHDGTVGVYSQADGERLASLPGVAHAREVVVDRRHNLAWASGFADGTVVAFDTRTYKEKARFTIEGGSPTGLAVNERTGAVYAADLDADRIIEVSARAEEPRFIPTGDGPLGIALSLDGHTAYTANQYGGTLSVVDLRGDRPHRDIPTGGGSKSVAVDPRSGQVLVANRTASTISVVDPRQDAVVESIATSPNPNHVVATRRAAFAVDKSAGGPEGQDHLYRIRVGH